MARGAIYIDDSGNPGTESGSDFLSATRKSWTAVVVPSSIAGAVCTEMKVFLLGVREEFGASELHFTDIYSGRGVWKKVPVEKRIEIFNLMLDLAERFSLPVVHQTVSDETLNDHANFGNKLPGVWWDSNNVSHFGFLLLCSKVSRYAREMHLADLEAFDLPMELFVDEGLAKAGSIIDLPNWADVIDGAKARFRSSLDTPELQIADFCAFSISRTQWIMAKQELGAEVKRADLAFLQITRRLNILNMPMVPFGTDNVSKEAYEFVLSRDRGIKGLTRRPNSSPRKR